MAVPARGVGRGNPPPDAASEEAEADQRADGAEAVAPRDLLALGVGAAVVGDRDLVEADRRAQAQDLGRQLGLDPEVVGDQRPGRARGRRGRPCSRPPCRRSSCCRGRWRAASGSGCRRSARRGARAAGARRRAGGCRRRRRPCRRAAGRSARGCPTASTRGRRPGSAGCRRGTRRSRAARPRPCPCSRGWVWTVTWRCVAARRASSAGESSVEPSSTSRISSVSGSSSSSSTTCATVRSSLKTGTTTLTSARPAPLVASDMARHPSYVRTTSQWWHFSSRSTRKRSSSG